MLLRNLGLKIIEHPFPDHHQFIARDLNFADNYPIIMTEKDAVKCKGFANKKIWVLAIDVKLPQKFVNALCKKLAFVQTKRNVL
jgi:tetraacyldisaccharide 4'-kinase